MFTLLERSEVSLEELLRQPAPIDHGPVVCTICGVEGGIATIDGQCGPCLGVGR
jgi:hypothetical protein